MKRWLKIAVPLGIAAVLLSVLAIGFGSPSSDAAPGGNGNGKGRLTISIAESNPYQFGETITFAVDGKEPNNGNLWLANRCFQGGELVYGESQRVVDGLAGPFTLGPTPSWSGGAADCEAQVFITGKMVKVTNITFSYHVEA